MSINPVLLSNIGLLRGIGPAHTAHLAEVMNLAEFDKGKIVVRKGDVPQHLCFLLSGQLQVIDWAEDGREISLGLIDPGSHFGELSILDGGIRSASVVATAPSKLLYLSRAEALKLIFGSVIVNQRIMLRLVEMVRTTSSKLTQLSNQPVQTRVAAILLQMAREEEPDKGIIEAVPSQKDMALMVSSTRESVSRCINEFARKGYLVRKDNALLIVSLKELRKLIH